MLARSRSACADLAGSMRTRGCWRGVLTLYTRVVCGARYMRTECLNHKFVYGTPMIPGRLVRDVADRTCGTVHRSLGTTRAAPDAPLRTRWTCTQVTRGARSRTCAALTAWASWSPVTTLPPARTCTARARLATSTSTARTPLVRARRLAARISRRSSRRSQTVGVDWGRSLLRVVQG